MKPFRIFVAGTDTGVGKTETACALLSLLADEGLNPAPFKPYESGCEELRRPADALALKAAARSADALAQICPHRFREPLAPGIAAELEGRSAHWDKTLEAFRAFRGRTLVGEGAGGLLVPIDARRMVIDLPVRFRLPVLLVARAGLGTLNHIGLSLEALSSRKVPALAVLLAHSTRHSDLSAQSNPAWLQARYGLPVLGPVPYTSNRASRGLRFRSALQRWLRSALGVPLGA